MRKFRCKTCKATFYTALKDVTECQDCTGTLPDKTATIEADRKNFEKSNLPPKKASQTLDIKALAEKEEAAKKAKPKTSGKKQKDSDDASTSAS